jgi:hypothetical protein
MELRARAEAEVARPQQATFDFAVACETFPRVLLPLGPLPGIRTAEMVGGARPEKGAHRNILLTDGNTIVEEVLVFERPARHAYRWLNRPAAPLSWLVRDGEGDWSFAPSARGTRIVWVYRFTLTSPLVAPLAWPVVRLFERWMQRGLDRVREQLEAAR